MASLIYIAALQALPSDYTEAAAIDGAGYWGRFRHVILPQILPLMVINFVGAFIAAFQVGQGVLQFSTTGGKNGNLTFLGLTIYNSTQSVGGYNFGYASALSYILFVIIAGLSVILFRYNKFVYYEGDN
jgi:ABC-type sugar transport system permease subunit